MMIARSEVARILMNCLKDSCQVEKVQKWSEPVEPDMPGLNEASAALLFAAALGDATSWESLTKLHPELASLDVSDMPTVLDCLFAQTNRFPTRSQP